MKDYLWSQNPALAARSLRTYYRSRENYFIVASVLAGYKEDAATQGEFEELACNFRGLASHT